MSSLTEAKDESDPPEEQEPEKSYEEFLKEIGQPQPPAGEALVEEPAELLGLCLWDLFSDNHEVIAGDGRVVDLGFFRGSAGMIADFFDRGSVPKEVADWWRDGCRAGLGGEQVHRRGESDARPGPRRAGRVATGHPDHPRHAGALAAAGLKLLSLPPFVRFPSPPPPSPRCAISHNGCANMSGAVFRCVYLRSQTQGGSPARPRPRRSSGSQDRR